MAKRQRRMTRVSVRERMNRPILGSSNDVALGSFDLFSTPPTQTDVESELFDKIYPVNGSLVQTNPDCVFQCHPSQHWTDLSESYFMMQVGLEKVSWPTNSDATITAANKVNASNFVGMSFWKDLQLELSGQLVTVNRGLAYFEKYIQMQTQTTGTSQAKWETAGYYRDLAQDQADPSITEANGGDRGIFKRFTRYGNGQKNWIYLPIMTPMACQMRALPSLVDIKITLVKGPAEWRYQCPINAPETYNMKLYDIILYLKRIKLYPAKLNQLESRLAGGAAAQFFIDNSFCRSYPIPATTTTIRIPDVLLTSYLPSYVLCAFMEQKDFRGNRGCSNFSFQHFNISQLYARAVRIDLTRGGVKGEG